MFGVERCCLWVLIGETTDSCRDSKIIFLFPFWSGCVEILILKCSNYLKSPNNPFKSCILVLSREKNLKACESMVYSGSTTTAGQPVLSPQPVIDAITQLDAMLKKLEETTLKVIRDIDHKKKVSSKTA